MRPIFFLVAVGFLTMFACNNNNGAKVLDKEVFTNMLTDMHITDAVLANKGLYDSRLKDSTQSYYHYLMKKYEVSRADFEHSLSYYSQNGEEYAKIYEKVIENINNEIPKSFHKNSIYRLYEMALEEAKVKSDLNKYYGFAGKDLWMGRRFYNLPKDTAHLSPETLKDIKYQGLVVFAADYLINKEDTSNNLRMELEIQYKDSTSDKRTEAISKENKDWLKHYIVLKTDSSKKPRKVKAIVISKEQPQIPPKVQIRNITLRQYAPDKDTSEIEALKKGSKTKEVSKKHLKKKGMVK